MAALFRRLPPVAKGPAQGYSEVLPVWKGGTVVCIATGPSLTDAQLETVRAARESGEVAGVIVVNDNYRRVPWADVLYFADPKWWNWPKDQAALSAFAGVTCSLDAAGKWGGNAATNILRHMGGQGLSLDPAGITTGSNSGHQALNIAALSGASRILLLGYDARRGDGKRVHWFGDHPDRTGPPYEAIVRNMTTTVAPLKQLGVEVINCTPGSAIDCFPRGDIASLVSDTERAVVSA